MEAGARNKSTFPLRAFLSDLSCLGPALRTDPQGQPSRHGSWMLTTNPVELQHLAASHHPHVLPVRSADQRVLLSYDERCGHGAGWEVGHGETRCVEGHSPLNSDKLVSP